MLFHTSGSTTQPSWSWSDVGHLRRLTPREIASTESSRADTDSAAIRSFARGDNGMVSVGLNAEELVIETYR